MRASSFVLPPALPQKKMSFHSGRIVVEKKEREGQEGKVLKMLPVLRKVCHINAYRGLRARKACEKCWEGELSEGVRSIQNREECCR